MPCFHVAVKGLQDLPRHHYDSDQGGVSTGLEIFFVFYRQYAHRHSREAEKIKRIRMGM